MSFLDTRVAHYEIDRRLRGAGARRLRRLVRRASKAHHAGAH